MSIHSYSNHFLRCSPEIISKIEVPNFLFSSRFKLTVCLLLTQYLRTKCSGRIHLINETFSFPKNETLTKSSKFVKILNNKTKGESLCRLRNESTGWS